MAEIYYKKAIDLKKISYGEEHPSLAINFSNLAGVYREKGKLKEAEALYQQAI